MDPDVRSVLTIFIWICGPLGLASIAYAIVDGMRSRRTANWPSTGGRVIESEIRAYRERSRGPHDRQTRGGNLPHLRYEYTVAGRRFVGNRVRWVDAGTGADWAQNLIAAYPVGRTVTVFYDPASPQSSVLEQGAAVAGSLSLIAGGAVLVAIAVVFRVIRGA